MVLVAWCCGSILWFHPNNLVTTTVGVWIGVVPFFGSIHPSRQPTQPVLLVWSVWSNPCMDWCGSIFWFHPSIQAANPAGTVGVVSLVQPLYGLVWFHFLGFHHPTWPCCIHLVWMGVVPSIWVTCFVLSNLIVWIQPVSNLAQPGPTRTNKVEPGPPHLVQPRLISTRSHHWFHPPATWKVGN
jgi:hypothetical protein